jgi:hypothetical protein
MTWLSPPIANKISVLEGAMETILCAGAGRTTGRSSPSVIEMGSDAGASVEVGAGVCEGSLVGERAVGVIEAGDAVICAGASGLETHAPVTQARAMKIIRTRGLPFFSIESVSWRN